MGKLSINIIANIIGRIWSAGIAILLVPQYIKFLGIESYGLIGIYTALISSLSILDFGLGTSLNRELAKSKIENKSSTDIRDLTFTLECIYWAIGILIALAIIFMAPYFANHWVKAENLSKDTIQNAIFMIGVVVAFHYPISLYNGGFLGLEKQIAGNIILVSMTTLRAAGVFILFWFFEPSLNVFFIWQAMISSLYFLVMRFGLWHYLPKTASRPSFSITQLMVIKKFAMGMLAISLVAFALSQIDKLLLSKLLPLSQFGFYSLSFTVSSSLSILVSPISVTLFPRFTALFASSDLSKIIKTYHYASRLVSTIIFSLGLTVMFFAKDILLIWTKNEVTTQNSFQLVQILVFSSILACLMAVPYTIILAKGWTKYAFIQNLVSILILVPTLYYFTSSYGMAGATFGWVIVNFGIVIFGISLVHQKILKNQMREWLLKDTLFPFAVSLVCILTLKYTSKSIFLVENVSLIGIIVILGLVFFVSFLFFPGTLDFIKALRKNSFDFFEKKVNLKN